MIGRSGSRVMVAAAQLIAVALLLALSGRAQSSPQPAAPREAPSARKLILLNGIQFGASIFAARGSWYGAHQCVVREELPRNPSFKFRRSLEISVPIDSAVSFISWKLRHRHPSVATALPLLSAGAQIGEGATLFSAGCM